MRILAPVSFLLFSSLLVLLPGESQGAAHGGGGGGRGFGGGGRGYSGGGGGFRGGGGGYRGGGFSGGYRGGYSGGFRGGYGGRYGGYGYRGGYFRGGYGYGRGFGFGLGFGWPYYGYGGYPYGYSSYYDYPSAAYYPAYDYAPVTAPAPAVPQVNVYTPQAYTPQAPVVRERQEPPVGRDSSGRLTSNQSNMYLIAFPDGSVQVAVAYWTDNGTLHYVTTDKVQKTVPISAIDLGVTQQLNRERGVAINIP
jgi:hypothetical protein